MASNTCSRKKGELHVRFVSVNQITRRFGDRSVRRTECSLRALASICLCVWCGHGWFSEGGTPDTGLEVQGLREQPLFEVTVNISCWKDTEMPRLFFVLFHWGQSNIKGPLCKNESHSQLVKHWRFVIAGRVSCQPKSSALNDTKKSHFLKFGPLTTVTLVEQFKAKHRLSGRNSFWANSSTCSEINCFQACKATTKRLKQPKSKKKQLKRGRNQLQRDRIMFYKGTKNNQKQTSDDN